MMTIGEDDEEEEYEEGESKEECEECEDEEYHKTFIHTVFLTIPRIAL